MQINGTLILLYFIEMLPHTVSASMISVDTKVQVIINDGDHHKAFTKDHMIYIGSMF